MRKTVFIITILGMGLLLYSFFSAAEDSHALAQGEFFEDISEKPNDEGALESGPETGGKRWLLIFGALAAPALLFLVVLEIGGGGLLPESIENIAVKACLGIIATALLLFFHYMTSSVIFIILIPAALSIIIYACIHRPLKNAYKKKFGKPSLPGGWICRNCGQENNAIDMECFKCGRRRPDEASGGVSDKTS